MTSKTIGPSSAFFSNYLNTYPPREGLLFQIENGIITDNLGNTQTSANPPTYNSNGWLDFNGTNQRLLYSTTSGNYGITVPYSIEFEAWSNISMSGRPYGCLFMTVGYNGGTPNTSSTANIRIGPWTIDNLVAAISSYSYSIKTPMPVNTWFKVGVMVYNNGGTRLRTYYNDAQVTDVAVTPLAPTNDPLSIGNSIGDDPYWINGRIRNMYIGRSLFWDI